MVIQKKILPWRLVTLETCNQEEVDSLRHVNTFGNDDINYNCSNYSNPTEKSDRGQYLRYFDYLLIDRNSDFPIDAE